MCEKVLNNIAVALPVILNTAQPVLNSASFSLCGGGGGGGGGGWGVGGNGQMAEWPNGSSWVILHFILVVNGNTGLVTLSWVRTTPIKHNLNLYPINPVHWLTVIITETWMRCVQCVHLCTFPLLPSKWWSMTSCVIHHWVRSFSLPGSTPRCSLGWAPDKS